ncbi:MAG: NMT1/THI5-like protein [Rhizobacter sp.]|nr:NMT1/THI5-like protein [Rhizobacter sp.]
MTRSRPFDATPSATASPGTGLSRRWLLAAGAAAGIAPWMAGAVRAADSQDSLKIGMANNVMTVIYPYITNTQQMGFFEKEGVKADVVLGQGTPQILSLLTSGTVDVAFCNPEQMIQLDVDRGMSLKSVFAASVGGYILASLEDSPVQTVAQLKGMKLGMFSPQSGIDYLKGRLLDAGLTTQDITILPISFGAQAIAAIRQKQVDAVLYWKDALTVMRSAGLKLREFPKAPWENGFYNYVAAVRTQTIVEKASALQKAVRAMAQGQMMSLVSPEATVAAYWQQYPDQMPKPEDRAAAMASNVNRLSQVNPGIALPATAEQLSAQKWGENSADVFGRIQDYMVRVGSLSKKADPATFFDNRFVDGGNQFDRTKLFAMADPHKK